MVNTADKYDAVLLVSFGGPEGPDDVLPFLQRVTQGRNVPPNRLQEVAEHYHQFGGVSPLNAQNRALIAALVHELGDHGPRLPIYWGNRNWHPLLSDALRQMVADGIHRALALVTSAYSSYSGCRQYLEDIERARAQAGPDAPRVDKLRVFYNHPGFIEPMMENVQLALEELPEQHRAEAEMIFTAHSIPLNMAQTCDYQRQLEESSRLVSEGVGHTNWRLVYQSRSGPPSQKWLEPDVRDVLRELAAQGSSKHLILIPIGFISDHLEVLFDLDVEAAEICRESGLNMVRAATVGVHPRFVQMIRELIVEWTHDQPSRLALGQYGPSHDICPADCCLFDKSRPEEPKK